MDVFERACVCAHAAIYVPLRCKGVHTLILVWMLYNDQASSQLQQLEEERMNSMQDYLNKFNSHISVLPPKMQQVHV